VFIHFEFTPSGRSDGCDPEEGEAARSHGDESSLFTMMNFPRHPEQIPKDTTGRYPPLLSHKMDPFSSAGQTLVITRRSGIHPLTNEAATMQLAVQLGRVSVY